MGKRARVSSGKPVPRRTGAKLRRLMIRGIASGISAAYSLAIDVSSLLRRRAAVPSTLDIPQMDLAGFGDRVLVVAPHPDDETLGCGGLIRALRERGTLVKVVFLTHGDGYWAAAGREARGLRWGEESYLELGRRRENEAWDATGRLGLGRDDLIFFGFPDRGLTPLWINHFDVPFQSPYTRADAPPYPSSLLAGCPYTGKALLSGLAVILLQFNPTAVLVPHPLDDHPDHSAAYAFTTAAQEMTRAGSRLFTYLVHRGHWPYPGRTSRRRPLEPPLPLQSVGTRWRAVTLTPLQEEEKRSALACYRSQTVLMKDFLGSFVRPNELFGQVELVWASSAESGEPAEHPQFIHPTRDSLARRLNRGVDIARVWVAENGDRLVLRLETVGSLKRGSMVRLLLRSFQGEQSRAVHLSFGVNGKAPQEMRVKGKFLEAEVALATLGNPDTVWIGIRTFRMGICVDKTGWQPVRLNSGNETKPQTYPPDQ